MEVPGADYRFLIIGMQGKEMGTGIVFRLLPVWPPQPLEPRLPGALSAPQLQLEPFNQQEEVPWPLYSKGTGNPQTHLQSLAEPCIFPGGGEGDYFLSKHTLVPSGSLLKIVYERAKMIKLTKPGF